MSTDQHRPRIKLDQSKIWLDRHGRRWEWTDHRGWVVDGRTLFQGYWPTAEHGPFTPEGHEHAWHFDGVGPYRQCTTCGAIGPLDIRPNPMAVGERVANMFAGALEKLEEIGAVHAHTWRIAGKEMCDGEPVRALVVCTDCGFSDTIEDDPGSVDLAAIYAAAPAIAGAYPIADGPPLIPGIDVRLGEVPALRPLGNVDERREAIAARTLELEAIVLKVRDAIDETNPYALDHDEFAAVLARLGKILDGDA